MPTALITGITGQDGAYLAELLLAKGYEVAGLVRRSSTPVAESIESIADDIKFVTGDLLDEGSLIDAVSATQPDEIYNLAAQSQVHASFHEPVLTAEVNAVGVTRLLNAIRSAAPDARFFHASTSEVFGRVIETPQSETTPMSPRNPYGVSKVYAQLITANYRDSHGIHASSGILFNHESPRRGLEFVTRKITNSVARIAVGLDTELRLGNLEAKRDWGFARDYVEAMWLMLQQNEPDDYVIATGETHSVRQFCDRAFAHVGLDYRDFVLHDESHVRPSEVELTVGDPSKARRVLGWEPRVTFEELVSLMVDADLALVSRST